MTFTDKEILVVAIIAACLLFLVIRKRRKSVRAQNTGDDYEYRVAKYLKRNHFRDVSVTSASRDYGVDIIARKGRKRYAIQCKYYSRPVGISAVQEAFTGMAHYDCNAAMVVTNSTFTKAAETLAEENGVFLISELD